MTGTRTAFAVLVDEALADVGSLDGRLIRERARRRQWARWAGLTAATAASVAAVALVVTPGSAPRVSPATPSTAAADTTRHSWRDTTFDYPSSWHVRESKVGYGPTGLGPWLSDQPLLDATSAVGTASFLAQWQEGNNHTPFDELPGKAPDSAAASTMKVHLHEATAACQQAGGAQSLDIFVRAASDRWFQLMSCLRDRGDSTTTDRLIGVAQSLRVGS